MAGGRSEIICLDVFWRSPPERASAKRHEHTIVVASTMNGLEKIRPRIEATHSVRQTDNSELWHRYREPLPCLGRMDQSYPADYDPHNHPVSLQHDSISCHNTRNPLLLSTSQVYWCYRENCSTMAHIFSLASPAPAAYHEGKSSGDQVKFPDSGFFQGFNKPSRLEADIFELETTGTVRCFKCPCNLS